MICQFFADEAVSRHIHMRSFRYGKDPSVIRCNRGDTLHITFSTDDTGHSFFLEEFDIDAKVSPARETVEVFKTTDPTEAPDLTKELVFTARHPGILNYLVSKSNYRCHVWCGPMHAFEHGKLIILPNTLLCFSLGCVTGILFLWILAVFIRKEKDSVDDRTRWKDLMKNSRLFQTLVIKRWPQYALTILAMLLFYVVILASLFGTKMSGRNLGVLLMWGIWLFILVAIMTPLMGRAWCTICPLPFFGDLIQRRAEYRPGSGSRGIYNNNFWGLFRKWPGWLQNGWPKLIILMILTTFSTTLVANPKVTGYAVLLLLIIPTLFSIVYEHRAFCRYLCPVSVFVGQFSRMSPVAIRNRSQKVCDRCKAKYCLTGSEKGWACPYGINVGELNENTECGMCLECTRSCLYNNVGIYSRPFGIELGTRTFVNAWTIIAVLVLAVVYCVLYQGHYPAIRDFVNILDKENWDLFGWYTVIVWVGTLAVVPGFLYGISWVGKKISGYRISTREIFLSSSGALLPLGLMLWIAFVIPMLFVNTTFITQSLSDPFGWGWDFFGTASIPWHQFVPRLVPWLQAGLVLAGLSLSLRNLRRTLISIRSNISRNGESSEQTDAARSPEQMDRTDKASQRDSLRMLLASLPMGIFILSCAVAMLFFFTN